MSTHENKAIVRRALEEFYNQGNMDITEELFAPDFANHDPAAQQATDLPGLIAQTRMRSTAFPDGVTTIVDLIAEGDQVVKRWTYQGTQTGEWNGLPPTGKRLTLTGVTVYRLVDGKIAECWWAYDVLGVLQQLGVMPEPANS